MTHSIKKNFDKAAETYDDNAIIQVKVGELLFNKLNFLEVNDKSGNVFLNPSKIHSHTLKSHTENSLNIIDLGAGTGKFSQKFLEKFPNANVFAFDLSHKMMMASKQKNSLMQCIQGDFDQMPFQSESIDIIFSNFSLQWSLDLPLTLSEITRLLKNNGYFLFTMPGPTTLDELKKSFEKIDGYTHINSFHSMKTIQTLLENNSLEVIHSQNERFKLQFNNIFNLLNHLKLSGANSVIGNPSEINIQKSLMTPKKLEALSNAYNTFLENGLYPTTYETFFFVVQKRKA